MRVRIDLAAYRRNLSTLSERLGSAALMAVVKDDAYGHGMFPVVDAAMSAGITRFAVLDIATGLALREYGVKRQNMLFAWLFGAEEDFGPAVANSIDLGISSLRVLDAVADAARREGSMARIHLKIDSGLHRAGAGVDEWEPLVSRVSTLAADGVVDPVGIWTHIGEASDEDDSNSLRVFEAALAVADKYGIHPSYRHVAASAASFARPEFRYDLARVGGFTYGIAPGGGLGPDELGIEPVMSLESTVTAIDKTGTSLRARLSGGYLDGIPAWLGPDAPAKGLPIPGFEVRIGLARYPIEAVRADHLVVALDSREPAVKVGDNAVLFGSHLRGEPVLQEWADALGTVGEEIVVRVGSKAPREFVGG